MTLEEAKIFFEKDRFVKQNGIEILEVESEYAVVGAKIEDGHLNAGNNVQGGMLYTLADFAFAVLSNSLHAVTVTHSAAITYVKAAHGCEYLYAKAKELSINKHNSVVSVVVYDEHGETYAVMQVNGFVHTQA